MIKVLVFIVSILMCISAPVSAAQEASVSNGTSKIETAQLESKQLDSTHSDNKVAESEQSGNSQQDSTQSINQPLEKTPEVGKHVMANVDASSMILSLIMVLALIFISAIVLKRFNLSQQNSSQLKVIASLSLGAKERVVVVQIGEQQLVLGVCPQQISLLKNLDQPIDVQVGKPLALSGNVLSFLQRNSLKTSTDNDVSTNQKQPKA